MHVHFVIDSNTSDVFIGTSLPEWVGSPLVVAASLATGTDRDTQKFLHHVRSLFKEQDLGSGWFIASPSLTTMITLIDAKAYGKLARFMSTLPALRESNREVLAAKSKLRKQVKRALIQ